MNDQQWCGQTQPHDMHAWQTYEIGSETGPVEPIASHVCAGHNGKPAPGPCLADSGIRHLTISSREGSPPVTYRCELAAGHEGGHQVTDGFGDITWTAETSLALAAYREAAERIEKEHDRQRAQVTSDGREIVPGSHIELWLSGIKYGAKVLRGEV